MHKKRKLFLWISFALFAVVLQCLASAGLLIFENAESGQNFTLGILLFTEYPLCVLSFVLGSIKLRF